MAVGSGLNAGKAVIKLSLLSGPMEKQLVKLEQRMKRFGENVAQVGKMGLAASGSLVAGFSAAAKVFAGAGDEVGKMAKRTGISAESLQELAFAAEQSGTNLGGMEKAVRRMNGIVLDAERGLATATDAMDDLGISSEELEGLNVEQKLLRFGEGLAKVADEGRRAALAEDIFGRAGTQLLPLFLAGSDGIQQLRDEFRELGGVMSEDQVEDAEALTDAMNRIRRQMLALVQQIGAAVAGPMTDWLTSQQENMKGAIDWVRANGDLIVTVAKVSAVVVAASATILVVAKAITIASAAIGALRVAITLLTAHPLVALVTLIAGAVVAVLHWVGALDWLLERMGKLIGLSQESSVNASELTAELGRLKAAVPDNLGDGVKGLGGELKGAADGADEAAKKLEKIESDAERVARETAELEERRAKALERVKKLNDMGFDPTADPTTAARPQALFDAQFAQQVFGEQPREQIKVARDSLKELQAIRKAAERRREMMGIPVG